uniref:Uncharacterized protein n=1 Tax=Anopheles dirus TaxID=7168 RepID=A0A182NWB3_9DIPT
MNKSKQSAGSSPLTLDKLRRIIRNVRFDTNTATTSDKAEPECHKKINQKEESL